MRNLCNGALRSRNKQLSRIVKLRNLFCSDAIARGLGWEEEPSARLVAIQLTEIGKKNHANLSRTISQVPFSFMR